MTKIPGTLHEIEITQSKNTGYDLTVRYRKEIIFQQTCMEDAAMVDEVLHILEKSNLNIPRNRIENVVDQEIQIAAPNKDTSFLEGAVSRVVESMQEKSGENIQKIILLGLGNAGKTCIYERVFEGKKPWELIHSKSTKGIAYKHYKLGSLASPMIWDLGGQKQYRDEYRGKLQEDIFKKASVLLFVLDVSDIDQIDEALKEFRWASGQLLKKNPDAAIYVFLHKIDLIIEKTPLVDHIRGKFAGICTHLIKYFPTSVFDESLFNAWSEIIQQISPRSNYINSMLRQLKIEPVIKDALLIEKVNGLAIGSTMEEEEEDVMVGMLSLLITTVDRVIKELKIEDFQEFSLKAINKLILLADVTKNIALVVILSHGELSTSEKEKISEICKQAAQNIKNIFQEEVAC